MPSLPSPPFASPRADAQPIPCRATRSPGSTRSLPPTCRARSWPRICPARYPPFSPPGWRIPSGSARPARQGRIVREKPSPPCPVDRRPAGLASGLGSGPIPGGRSPGAIMPALCAGGDRPTSPAASRICCWPWLASGHAGLPIIRLGRAEQPDRPAQRAWVEREPGEILNCTRSAAAGYAGRRTSFAAIPTGWSINAASPGFVFRPRHEPGPRP